MALLLVRIRSLARALLLAAVFIVFAVLPVFYGIEFFAKLSPHPSPLCALTKPIMFSLNMKQIVFPPVFATILLLIAFLSIIGNKLFCGWVCPIGALQEIVYLGSPRLGKYKLSFVVVNMLRVILLILLVPILIRYGIYLYGYFNPFEIIHWPFATDFWVLYTWAVILITISASLFLFRPFCHCICSIGALTWFLEWISLAKIRLREEKYNQCKLCIKHSPCLAVPSILNGKNPTGLLCLWQMHWSMPYQCTGI